MEDELKLCDDDCENCDVDPIIKEIHAIRHKHSEKFNHDIHAIFEDYRSKHPIIMEMMEAVKKDDHKTVETLRQKLQI